MRVAQPSRRGKSKPAAQLSLHDATESYLGYAYQGLFALLVLLRAADEEEVSVETSDDVLLDGTEQTLHQLKHSRRGKTARPITLRDERWWKTVAIWIEHYRLSPGRYVLVSSAPIALGDPLQVLTGNGDRTVLREAMNAEVQRVMTLRFKAEQQKSRVPFAKAYPGVSQFAGLSTTRQLDFLKRISAQPHAGDISELPMLVMAELQSVVLPDVRPRITERLIEWWDRRVVRGLIGHDSRRIAKAELQDQLSGLIAQHRGDSLPDDFGEIDPPPNELEWEGTLVDQIKFVEAGRARIIRALEAHWRAIRQRERWMAEDISVRSQLSEFDARLRRAWRDRHAPMCDDCSGKNEEVKKALGRELLDWSHLEAFRVVAPIRTHAPHDYLTQGTYQLLAQAGELGWHPDYVTLLRALRKRKNAP